MSVALHRAVPYCAVPYRTVPCCGGGCWVLLCCCAQVPQLKPKYAVYVGGHRDAAELLHRRLQERSVGVS